MPGAPATGAAAPASRAPTVPRMKPRRSGPPVHACRLPMQLPRPLHHAPRATVPRRADRVKGSAIHTTSRAQIRHCAVSGRTVAGLAAASARAGVGRRWRLAPLLQRKMSRPLYVTRSWATARRAANIGGQLTTDADPMKFTIRLGVLVVSALAAAPATPGTWPSRWRRGRAQVRSRSADHARPMSRSWRSPGSTTPGRLERRGEFASKTAQGAGQSRSCCRLRQAGIS